MLSEGNQLKNMGASESYVLRIVRRERRGDIGNLQKSSPLYVTS